MSEKSDKSGKHISKRKNIIKDYFLDNIVFLFILIVITIAVIFAAIKPVTELVHRAEAASPMEVKDVDIKDSFDITSYDPEKTEYGDCVANITCEDIGLNTYVFFGLNRVSMRKGAGLHGKGSFFTEKGLAIAAGYDETYFAALKYIEQGDIITVSTADGTTSYKVSDAYYESRDLNLDNTRNELVLYSYFSNFSDNAGKCFYVFADKISGEDN